MLAIINWVVFDAVWWKYKHGWVFCSWCSSNYSWPKQIGVSQLGSIAIIVGVCQLNVEPINVGVCQLLEM